MERMNDSRKKARNVITRPIRAAMMVLLAVSTLPLSPPDIIHFMPPQIKKNKATNAAPMKSTIIIVPITPGRLSLFILQREFQGGGVAAHGSRFTSVA